MKKQLPPWLVLSGIAILVAAVLGGVNHMTEGKILQNALEQAERDRKVVFAAADEFRPVELDEDSDVDALYEAYGNGTLLGYLTELTVTGCQGPIEVMTGFDTAGSIVGVNAGGSDFSETPGLGARVQEPEFLGQFPGLSIPLKLKEDVDSVSGATISSASVVSAVNTSGYYLNSILNPTPEQDLPEDLQFGGVLPGATTKTEIIPAPEGVDALFTSDAGVVAYVTGQGRNGDIAVQVGVANSGQVAGVYIDPEGHRETEGKGDLIEQAYFLNQFLGRSAPFVTGENVDAVSGATISSDAVIDCVNRASDAATDYLDASAAYDIAPLYAGLADAVPGVPAIKAENVAAKVEMGSGVTVMTAADWSETYPEIYASYMRNAENSETTDYLVDYPMLPVLYEGYGFAISYASARGHFYDITDLTETGRPHALANCFTCKTPNFTAMVNELGDEAYSLPFEDVMQQVNEPISCYNCHANQPGIVTITHTYLTDSVGDDFESIDAANLACGQCHVEYYFYPGTKAATLPHDSLASMHPDAILDYYNNILLVDGEPFADWTNPRTGVRQIKVQHPEMETFLLEGSPHRDTFTCADCHMGDAVAEDGTVYRNHYLTSPLDNTDLIENTCSECHADLVSEVRAVQEEAERRTYAIGYELQFLTETLADAVECGRYTEEELNAVRAVARDAQFYWDFVFVENAEGAHNPTLTHECLDKAEALTNEALGMLSR